MNTVRDESDGEYEDRADEDVQATARAGHFARSVTSFFGLQEGVGRGGVGGTKGQPRGTPPEPNRRSSSR